MQNPAEVRKHTQVRHGVRSARKSSAPPGVVSLQRAPGYARKAWHRCSSAMPAVGALHVGKHEQPAQACKGKLVEQIDGGVCHGAPRGRSPCTAAVGKATRGSVARSSKAGGRVGCQSTGRQFFDASPLLAVGQKPERCQQHAHAASAQPAAARELERADCARLGQCDASGELCQALHHQRELPSRHAAHLP